MSDVFEDPDDEAEDIAAQLDGQASLRELVETCLVRLTKIEVAILQLQQRQGSSFPPNIPYPPNYQPTWTYQDNINSNQARSKTPKKRSFWVGGNIVP